MVILLLICCNMPIFINYVNSIMEKIVQVYQRFDPPASPLSQNGRNMSGLFILVNSIVRNKSIVCQVFVAFFSVRTGQGSYHGFRGESASVSNLRGSALCENSRQHPGKLPGNTCAGAVLPINRLSEDRTPWPQQFVARLCGLLRRGAEVVRGRNDTGSFAWVS